MTGYTHMCRFYITLCVSLSSLNNIYFSFMLPYLNKEPGKKVQFLNTLIISHYYYIAKLTHCNFFEQFQYMDYRDEA